MALSGTITVTGSTADFLVNASGSGFGIFSSYSVYAAQALSFGSPEDLPLNSNLNVSVSLDTSLGSLVFSGSDNIQIQTFDLLPGVDDGTVYRYTPAEQLSFIHGSDTLPFADVPATSFGASGGAQLTSEAGQFFSSILSFGGGVSLPDSVASAIGSAIAIVMAGNVTVGGAPSTNYTLGQSGGQIIYTPMPPNM